MEGYGIASKSTSPRTPEFQAVLKRLSEVNGRLNELSAIAGQSADRIVGTQPEEATGSPKLDTVPDGYLSEISKAVAEAGITVERIYRNVTRITNEF